VTSCASTRARASIWSEPSSLADRRDAAPPRLRAVEWIDARLQGWGARGIIATIGVLWILVIVADYVTGPQLSLTLFYLMPIGVAAWYLGWRAGLAMALFGTATWFLSDLANGMAWSSEGVRYWNTAVRGGVFLVLAYVIAMLRHILDQERDLARTDSLTGVSNWRHFSELAEREMSRARRYRKPISLAYIDVDDFKKINDTDGHMAGDELLRLIAKALGGAMRLTDVVARVGGDEFVILLPDQDQAGARTAIDKVQSALDALADSHDNRIGFSIGVVTAAEAPQHVETLVKAADSLMYGVKAGGKCNGVFQLMPPVPARRTGPNDQPGP
jgi:diguanylate cyclase (GGDEF)-like protein